LAEHAHDVERTVLFGSVARGDSSPESDVDLLVVWRGSMSVARNVLAHIEAVDREGLLVA